MLFNMPSKFVTETGCMNGNGMPSARIPRAHGNYYLCLSMDLHWEFQESGSSTFRSPLNEPSNPQSMSEH